MRDALLWLVLIGLLLVPGDVMAAAGCPGTIVFDNSSGTGLWQTAQNWDTNLLPGGSDDVCIPAGMNVTLGSGTQSIGTLFVEMGASLAISAGSLSVSGASQVNGVFVFSGGTLSGAGEVTMNGSFAWTGGTMSGTGTTNANGGVAFSGAGVKDISGGRVLNTAGTTTWTGGMVRPGSGAVIRNSGLWDVQGDTSLALLANPLPRFDNLAGGTFRKSAGTGTMSANFPFNNSGALEVQSGTVSLNGGGSGDGTFSASAGATLAFNGLAYFLLVGSSLDASALVVGNNTTLDVFGTFNVSGSITVTGSGIPGLARFNSAATVTSLGSSVSLATGILELNTGEPVNLTSLSLTASGSALRGSDTVTVANPITWTAGTMTGTGTTNANGGIAFSGTGLKDISGSRVLNTAGTTTWTGGSIRPGSGAVIRNSGLWDVQGDTSLALLANPAPRFDNLAGGTFRKSAGTGTMSANVTFTNAGTLSVLSGTVSLTGGGSGAGTYLASPGATLAFQGLPYSLLSGSSLDAAAVLVDNGSVLDVSGTFTVSTTTTVTAPGTQSVARFNPAATVNSLGTDVILGNGILDLNSGEPINLATLSLTASGSSLRGTDTVTVSSPIDWTAGDMTGTGTTNANGGIAFSGAGVKDLTGGRVLNTTGTTTWTGGPVRPGSGASIRNAGVWDVQGDTSLIALSGAAPLFLNQAGATFRKSDGPGTASINVPFTNAGALSALSGTIGLAGGGSGTGTFSASPGATLLFDGGIFTLLSGSSVDASAVVVDHAGTLDVFGTYAVTNSTTVTAPGVQSLARFNPAATVTSLGAQVVVGNGILELNSGEAINLTGLSLTGTGGWLRGTDTVTVSGPIIWTAGLMSGAATTNANGGIVFSGPAVKDLIDGRMLNTAGTTTWTGGTFRPGGGAVIRNSGVWDIQADASMTVLTGAPPLFVNQAGGTFQKSAGAGTAAIAVPFTSAGSVRGLAGTLSFSGGYTQTAGSTSVEGGSIASSTPLDIQGGSLAGSGTFAAAVTNAGSLAPGLPPGAMSPGAVTITGACTQTAAATYDVEIGGLAPGAGHDSVGATGGATLAGTLNVTFIGGFSPADLNMFTIMTFPSSTGEFAVANLPTLGGDLVWKVHHNPQSYVLEVLADLDGDGVRNSSDCRPSDPTVWAAPDEASGVTFTAGGQMSWSSLAAQAGPATLYDVVRGLVSELPVGSGASETCLASDLPAGQVTDTSSPPRGAAFYYLVRGANVCGVGTYGTTSTGVPHVTTACP